MHDRDRVIHDIERCICHVPDACRDCSKYKDAYTPDCMEQLLADALGVLKEQEPVKVRHLHGTKVSMHEEIVFKDQCGYCGGYLLKSWKACPICGKAVKWE